jgi:hypothetical protein
MSASVFVISQSITGYSAFLWIPTSVECLVLRSNLWSQESPRSVPEGGAGLFLFRFQGAASSRLDVP